MPAPMTIAVARLFFMRPPWSEGPRDEHCREPRQESDQHHADGKHDSCGPCGAKDLAERLPEAGGGEEEVHAHRRCEIAELHVGEEDDPEMQRIDAKGRAERQ